MRIDMKIKIDPVVTMKDQTMVIFNKRAIDVICKGLLQLQEFFITTPKIKIDIDKTLTKMMKIRQTMDNNDI